MPTPKQTSPKPPVDETVEATTDPTVDETVEATPSAITADTWAVGDGALQVPLAGLLASNPDLRTAELTSDEWAEQLQDYLESDRV